ncbi:MAG: cyclopropane-fatty-acyl-phospholipid synthase family protein [Gammaproteobacteria bacterium]|nr:cyclopropane-fatty-acyl-phospholipid synthase family protein [Gammaproteobacteria bacterium]NND37635.1 class I SAM-dependent methyltransferase [Gammaproteobacteria bacterium]
MKLLTHMLRKFIRRGTLRVIEADGHLTEIVGTDAPFATIRLSDPSLPLKLFRNPELYAGEAYMDGTLTFEDCMLEDFLGLFSINRATIANYPLQSVLRSISKLVRTFQQHNPIGRAQQNVSHHYDLSEELYRLFLDEDMQYSCAYFENGDETLEQAQEKKKRHIAAKLRLEDGQKILDIGCGWGGMALYLARCANVEVLGVTLSEEQHRVAVERARAAGLDDRVRFELRDYRHVNERFDRIVSVGMFEHVGVRRYDEFFGKVFELLTEDGLGLLHSIGHMSPPSTASPWLRKYIFPGAYSPALSEVFAATERQHLWISDVEVLRVHYADTLVEWNRRFQANRERVAELYDERFCRMWEFYLISAETMFRTGAQMVFHMQFARNREAAQLTRDYMFETENAYRSREQRHSNAA